ncbi:hypothetical protein [Hymenobacter coccineus]|uniref:hypothetical protein n=1 Tax=Hymenobacter coccineus TaxID=1908235 RepID=UPI0013015E24|nr:hypothetical protein [Hymenobacter coccineus]
MIVGRWSRPNPPVTVATFSELTAPANSRTPNTNNSILLVRNNAQQMPITSALALF